MKLEYGKQRDEFLCETGKAVTKKNFLQIYGKTHLKVLQPDLIQTAF